MFKQSLRFSKATTLMLVAFLFLPILFSNCKSDEKKNKTSDSKYSPEAEKDIADDIKPPLTSDKFDKEQMRITKLVYDRIMEKQEDEKRSLSFSNYKDKLDSGVIFEMLPVNAGSFIWKGKEEQDTLEVTLSPFWMGKTEVTWNEYQAYIFGTEKHPVHPRSHDGSLREFMTEHANDIDFIARPTSPYVPVAFYMKVEGYPAIRMTQHAANKYCQWISYQTGHFYRLPTEAEWEYACRAGSNKKYSWGDSTKNADQYAWFGGDNKSHYNKPAQKKPNAWGFYDMHGNVSEWTLDQLVPNRRTYFNKTKLRNPWIRATKPYPHVVKGGHWQQKIEAITAAAQIPSSHKWKSMDVMHPKNLWYNYILTTGIRIVRPKEIPTLEEMYHYWNSDIEFDQNEIYNEN